MGSFGLHTVWVVELVGWTKPDAVTATGTEMRDIIKHSEYNNKDKMNKTTSFQSNGAIYCTHTKHADSQYPIQDTHLGTHTQCPAEI